MVDEDGQRAGLLGDPPDDGGEVLGLLSGSPAAGSSSSTSRGWPTTARAISTRRR